LAPVKTSNTLTGQLKNLLLDSIFLIKIQHFIINKEQCIINNSLTTAK